MVRIVVRGQRVEQFGIGVDLGGVLPRDEQLGDGRAIGRRVSAQDVDQFGSERMNVGLGEEAHPGKHSRQYAEEQPHTAGRPPHHHPPEE
ncbi:hypothetical protein [Streptomyces sp. NBC_00069]|uniref:hypothetical protein n=1 Tax=Streptomyces sp. NBC_00069 TaxID=2975639 RepID=UPI0032513CEF